MRLFTLSQSAGIYHQKPFCQKFAKSQSDLVVIVCGIPAGLSSIALGRGSSKLWERGAGRRQHLKAAVC
jgi:hypothetical protein